MFEGLNISSSWSPSGSMGSGQGSTKVRQERWEQWYEDWSIQRKGNDLGHFRIPERPEHAFSWSIISNSPFLHSYFDSYFDSGQLCFNDAGWKNSMSPISSIFTESQGNFSFSWSKTLKNQKNTNRLQFFEIKSSEAELVQRIEKIFKCVVLWLVSAWPIWDEYAQFVHALSWCQKLYR